MSKQKLTELYTQTKNEGALPVFVVTFGTKDFGAKYVVRLHVSSLKGSVNNAPTLHHVTADSHQELREFMPDECTVINRSPNDDPVIVEMWL
jgi:hypothetical protein